MIYNKLIVTPTDATHEEAVYVEALMRETYRYLDGIDRSTFRREAKEALKEFRKDPGTYRDLYAHQVAYQLHLLKQKGLLQSRVPVGFLDVQCACGHARGDHLDEAQDNGERGVGNGRCLGPDDENPGCEASCLKFNAMEV
jgi:hypothetical protein